MKIKVNGKSINVSIHPEFTAYSASKDGRIFTRPAVRRKGAPRSGAYPRADYWVEVSQFVVQPKHTPKYKKCRITQDGKTKLVSAHRFILECWVGIKPRTIVVRHLNGSSLNNALSNLKYGTVKENVQDAFQHIGNYAEGIRNGRARLNEADVVEIRARSASGESAALISKDYPFVNRNSIYNVINRTTWAHID